MTTILDPRSINDSVLFRATTYDVDGVTLITPTSCVCSVWTAGGSVLVNGSAGTVGAGYAQYNWSGSSTSGRFEATLTVTLSSGVIQSEAFSVEIIDKPSATTSARAGMSDLIQTVREMADCGLNDFEIAGVAHWSNKHIQTVLDRHRSDIYREPLASIISYQAGGSVSFLEYRSQYQNYEQTTGGTAIFIVEDGSGNDAGTALWSADYANGIITFAATTGGSAYYLTGRSYNLPAAAADIWRTKAAQAAKLFSFSTDNHSLSRNQVYEHCIQMAQMYERQGPMLAVTIGRSDTP